MSKPFLVFHKFTHSHMNDQKKVSFYDTKLTGFCGPGGTLFDAVNFRIAMSFQN